MTPTFIRAGDRMTAHGSGRARQIDSRDLILKGVDDENITVLRDLLSTAPAAVRICSVEP
jgi:hypothetical protein